MYATFTYIQRVCPIIIAWHSYANPQLKQSHQTDIPTSRKRTSTCAGALGFSFSLCIFLLLQSSLLCYLWLKGERFFSFSADLGLFGYIQYFIYIRNCYSKSTIPSFLSTAHAYISIPVLLYLFAQTDHILRYVFCSTVIVIFLKTTYKLYFIISFQC